MLHTIFALLLTIFFSTRTETHTSSQCDHKKETYKKYFEQQEKIYKELSEKGIPGGRFVNMDENLAEEVIANCPKKIKEAISDIEQGLFFEGQKNMILHGKSGTGKSCLAQAIAIKLKLHVYFLMQRI